MAKGKFDLQQEYEQQPAGDMYSQAAGDQQQEAPESTSISLSADQLTQLKSLASEEKFDEMGRIITSLIS